MSLLYFTCVCVCVLARVYRHVPDRYLQYANQCQSHAVGMTMTAAALFLYFTPIYGNTWRWFDWNLHVTAMLKSLRSHTSVLIMGVCCSHILHMTLFTLKTEEFFPALLDEEFFLRAWMLPVHNQGSSYFCFLWERASSYFLGLSNLEEQDLYLKQLEDTIVGVCARSPQPGLRPA